MDPSDAKYFTPAFHVTEKIINTGDSPQSILYVRHDADSLLSAFFEAQRKLSKLNGDYPSTKFAKTIQVINCLTPFVTDLVKEVKAIQLVHEGFTAALFQTGGSTDVEKILIVNVDILASLYERKI